MVAVALLTGFVFLYKDKLIQLFVAELNKYINTPVTIQKIDLSIWEKFPQTSLVFENVEMKGSLPNDSATFLKTNYIYLSFNIWEALNQQYSIHKIYIEDAEIHLLIDKNGKSNYEVVKQDTTHSTNETLKKSTIFDLDKILLKNIAFRFENRLKLHDYNTLIHQANGTFSYNTDLMSVKIASSITSNYIAIDGSKLLKNKKLELKSELTHELDKKQFIINPSEIRLNESIFEFKGMAGTGSKSFIDLNAKGKNTTIKTLLSLLPDKLNKQLEIYKTKGDLFFNAIIEGEISSSSSPQILVEFGCKNSSIYHPETKLALKELSFTGLYNNGANTNDAQATLAIRDIVGNLNNEKFSGNFILNNFSDPYVQADLQTKQKIKDLLNFYPIQAVTSADGEIELTISFAGKTNDLSSKTNQDKIQVSGYTKLDIPNLKLKDYQLPLQKLLLTSRFNNNELAVEEFSAKIGQSDISISGVIYKIIPYLIYKNQVLKLDANFKANQLQLNEMLDALPKATETSMTDTTSTQKIIWPKNINLDLKGEVNYLEFKRFKLKEARLAVKANDNFLKISDLQTRLAGGKITLDASIYKTISSKFHLEAKLDIKDIHIDTCLYLFENFGQQFITEKNLEGQLTTNIEFYSNLNNKLEIEPKSIFCNANVLIKNGRLKHFEPLKQLSKVIDEQALEDVKFSELKNNIHIEDGIIYLPEMEIKSNLNSISVMGTHTFEGMMDYKLKVSLKNRNKKDKDEEFGIIKDDKTGNTQLFLSLKGTSDNFKISLDKQAVKQKLKESWKKEKDEFKNLLKNNPPKEEKAIELNHEEMIELE